MAPKVDAAAVRQALRAAQSLTSRQLRVYELLSGRADGVVRLGVAELGGIAAITGFALGVGSMSSPALVLILMSVVLAMVGVVLALAVAAGQKEPRMVRLGLDLDHIRDAVEHESPSETEINLRLVGTHAVDARHNQVAINRVASRLALASYWLIAAAGTFMTAVIFIVGEAIHA